MTNQFLKILGLGLFLSVFYKCNFPSNPVVKDFFLLYDIVCVIGEQQAGWKTSNADKVTLTIIDENDSVVFQQEVPRNTGNGTYDPPANSFTGTIPYGSYTAKLTAINGSKSHSREAEFILLGRNGMWFEQNVFVSAPNVNNWTGIQAFPVIVSNGQGAPDQYTEANPDPISVSSNITCTQISWEKEIGSIALWNKLGENCPGTQAAPPSWKFMTVQKSGNNSSSQFEMDRAYPFPSQWSSSFNGQYLFTNLWGNCGIGPDKFRLFSFKVKFFIQCGSQP